LDFVLDLLAVDARFYEPSSAGRSDRIPQYHASGFFIGLENIGYAGLDLGFVVIGAAQAQAQATTVW
jgi:hypothetical protein